MTLTDDIPELAEELRIEWLEDVATTYSASEFNTCRNSLNDYFEWLDTQNRWDEWLSLPIDGCKSHCRWLSEQEADVDLGADSGYEYDEWTVSERISRIKAWYRHLDDSDRVGSLSVGWYRLEASEYRSRDRNVSRIDNETHGRRVFSDDEVALMLDNVPSPETRNRLLIRLMLCTGLRPGKAGRILLDEVNEEDRRLIAGKFKTEDKVRPLALPRSLMPLYRKWRYDRRDSYRSARDSEFLFVSRKSNVMNSSAVGKVVRKAADRSGIEPTTTYDSETGDVSVVDSVDGYEDARGNHRHKYTAHVCRHTYAVNFLENGGDIYTLKEILNHSSITSTLKYSRMANLESMMDKQRDFAPEF